MSAVSIDIPEPLYLSQFIDIWIGRKPKPVFQWYQAHPWVSNYVGAVMLLILVCRFGKRTLKWGRSLRGYDELGHSAMPVMFMKSPFSLYWIFIIYCVYIIKQHTHLQLSASNRFYWPHTTAACCAVTASSSVNISSKHLLLSLLLLWTESCGGVAVIGLITEHQQTWNLADHLPLNRMCMNT